MQRPLGSDSGDLPSKVDVNFANVNVLEAVMLGENPASVIVSGLVQPVPDAVRSYQAPIC